MTKYYELTEFPQLYKTTYWGGFTGEIDKKIIENRNKLAKEYALSIELEADLLKKSAWKTWNWLNFEERLDHCEIYLAHPQEVDFKVYILQSPYEHEGLDRQIEEKYLYPLYMVIPPVYCKSARSMIADITPFFSKDSFNYRAIASKRNRIAKEFIKNGKKSLYYI